MPKKTTVLTTTEVKGALPIGWQKFIDEYFANGFNGTKAYMAVFPESKLSSARECARKLLTKVDIKKQIKFRVEAQGGTDDYIVKSAIEYIEKGKGEKEWAMPGAKVLETLAKVKGLIKDAEKGNRFDNANFLVYSPMVDPKDIKKVQDFIAGAGRIIE